MTNYPFKVYEKYVAVKLHFDGKLDYNKFNGKSKVNKSSFNNRKDLYHFVKLSEKYKNIEEIEQLFISNCMYNDSFYIIDLRSSEADRIYRKWKSRLESIEYHFDKDVMLLANEYGKLSTTFKNDGFYPGIIEKVFHQEIYLETLVIFYYLFPKAFAQINKEVDDIIWKDFYDKFLRYTEILKKYKFDNKKLVKIVKRYYNK